MTQIRCKISSQLSQLWPNTLPFDTMILHHSIEDPLFFNGWGQPISMASRLVHTHGSNTAHGGNTEYDELCYDNMNQDGDDYAAAASYLRIFCNIRYYEIKLAVHKTDGAGAIYTCEYADPQSLDKTYAVIKMLHKVSRIELLYDRIIHAANTPFSLEEWFSFDADWHQHVIDNTIGSHLDKIAAQLRDVLGSIDDIAKRTAIVMLNHFK